MRLSPAELRDAIDAACGADRSPPLVADADQPHKVNLDGDLDLRLLGEAIADRLAANLVGRAPLTEGFTRCGPAPVPPPPLDSGDSGGTPPPADQPA